MPAGYKLLPAQFPASRASSDTWRRVQLDDGRVFAVGIVQGRSVRMAYSSKRGHEWYAIVNDEKGKTVYRVKAFKDASVKRILGWAGLLTPGSRA